MNSDTIAAIATATSPSGIGIVRISGEDTLDIIDRIYHSKDGKKKISKCKSHTIHYGYIYDEDEVVINAIASHHGDTPATSIISSLVAIADTISASRPGARNDSLENYVKRLQQLEEIANSFDGVEKSFAMQAGRDLRVIVKPEEMDELTSIKVARDIKDRIENEMQYPGTIRITVIRETRAVEEAR